MVITKNQGISSILESHISDETSNKSSSSSSSLRRTLSADMSSTKWLTQHGVSPMKKIASSEEFSICSITDSSSSEDDDDETEPRSRFDIWSTIIQQKSQVITDLPPPYIHPLVKRSAASSLTQKSLQICTESLGSETGSDGLISSYPSSDSGDVTDDDKDMEQSERSVEQSFDNFEEQGSLPVYNYVKKSLQRRSFPPPMPSRSMQSRRDSGRLILESVSVSSTNNFLAQRRDGRLVLTFANTFQQEEKEVQELIEEEFESFDDEDKESDDEAEEEEEEAAFVMELQAPNVSTRVINLHRLTLIGLANRDTTLTTWPNKFNEVVKFYEVDEDIKPAIVAKSLPPMARLIPKSSAAAAGTAGGAGRGGGGGSGAASLNTYEYYWRPKPMATTQSKSNKKNNQEEQQQLLLLRGNKGENLVPWVKSCKEPRRSLLFWKPYCIATS